jgi:hypothetical protein
MENRNGLLLQTLLSEASGRAERDAALLMPNDGQVGDYRFVRRIGTDKRACVH